MEKFFALATPANIMSDTRAFLDYLAAQPDVKPGGDRHHRLLHGRVDVADRGGHVSGSHRRHRLVSRRPARDRRAGEPAPAGAEDQVRASTSQARSRTQSFPDDMKARLEDALTEAGVDHTIETYPAKHGWVFRDTPVYDAAAPRAALADAARAVRREAQRVATRATSPLDARARRPLLARRRGSRGRARSACPSDPRAASPSRRRPGTTGHCLAAAHGDEERRVARELVGELPGPWRREVDRRPRASP